MPSLFELILGSAAKHNDVLREQGAKIMDWPALSVDPAPTREELDRLKGKCVGVYGPELQRFVPPADKAD